MGAAVRIVTLLGAAIGLAAFAAACGDDDQARRADTLPPINTTTTTTTTTTPPTTRPKTYEIQQGESLSAIAERYGLNWLELAEFNDIKDPDDIQAGQVIKLPPDVAPPTPPTRKKSN